MCFSFFWSCKQARSYEHEENVHVFFSIKTSLSPTIIINNNKKKNYLFVVTLFIWKPFQWSDT